MRQILCLCLFTVFFFTETGQFGYEDDIAHITGLSRINASEANGRACALYNSRPQAMVHYTRGQKFQQAVLHHSPLVHSAL